MFRIAKPAATGHPASMGTWRKFAIAAGALLTLGTFSAPAFAKPFQQYLNGACGPTLCTINFAKVPAGQRLSISSVSCYVRLGFAPNGFAPEIRAAQLLVLGANPNNVLNAVTLVPATVSRSGEDNVYSANHSIAAFANPNQRFQAYIEITRGTFSQVACHISGDLARAT